ncbi:MAG: hypothetical protein ACLSIR_04210 [Christensenellales bacterium]
MPSDGHFHGRGVDRHGEAIRHLFTGIVPLLVVPGVMFLLTEHECSQAAAF